MKVNKHADRVVASFKESLSKSKRKLLSENDYQKLQILIEAAIANTAECVLEDCAKDIEKLAKKARKRAKFIDQLEK